MNSALKPLFVLRVLVAVLIQLAIAGVYVDWSDGWLYLLLGGACFVHALTMYCDPDDDTFRGWIDEGP